jgi:hypothetical protein
MSEEKRKESIQWWENRLYEIQSILTKEHFGSDRFPASLTDEEIKIIYEKEVKFITHPGLVQ